MNSRQLCAAHAGAKHFARGGLQVTNVQITLGKPAHTESVKLHEQATTNVNAEATSPLLLAKAIQRDKKTEFPGKNNRAAQNEENREDPADISRVRSESFGLGIPPTFRRRGVGGPNSILSSLPQRENGTTNGDLQRSPPSPDSIFKGVGMSRHPAME